MAVDTFIWIYAIAFGVATIISVTLLIVAAREIGKNKAPVSQTISRPVEQDFARR